MTGSISSARNTAEYKAEVILTGKVPVPENVDAFKLLLRTNFDVGMTYLRSTYREMEDRHFEGNAFVRNLAGGAPESISWALYNAVGERYPSLARAQRDAALASTLEIMDRITYTIVNGLDGAGHTTGIRERCTSGKSEAPEGCTGQAWMRGAI